MLGIKLVLLGMQVSLVGVIFDGEPHFGLIYFGFFLSLLGLGIDYIIDMEIPREI